MDVSPELADNATPAADSALAYWTGNDGAWWYAQLTGSRNLPLSFWLLQPAGVASSGLTSIKSAQLGVFVAPYQQLLVSFRLTNLLA